VKERDQIKTVFAEQNKDLQEFYYSGKEKAHGLKFLAVIFPNGMICLHGPERACTCVQLSS
jgi:hypothetical protein